MDTLFQISSLACLAVCLGLFSYNLFKRKYLLTSWRNLFLAGFAYFYGVGGFFTPTVYKWADRFVASDVGFEQLALLMPLFLLIFLPFSAIGFRLRAMTKFIPKIEVPITTPGIIVSALVLLAIASVFAFIPATSYIGLLAYQFRAGMAACATGLALFYLLAQRFNPAAWAIFISFFLASALISITGGAQRRFVLSTLIMVPWAWYFFALRFKNPVGVALRFGALATIAFLALTVYSRFRHGGQDYGFKGARLETRIQQLSDALDDPVVDEGIVDLMLFTDTANNTMFIIEAYPDSFRFTPFAGAVWVIVNPIPRAIWPGKPLALGEIIQDQMEATANLGPGVIGHGWSEAGYFGVIYYAIFFGLVVGVIDRALYERAWNPYFVCWVACNSGNVLALPRGDTPLFTLQIAASLVSSGLVLYGLKTTLGIFFGAFAPIYPPVPGDDSMLPADEHDGYDYDEYAPDEQPEPTHA